MTCIRIPNGIMCLSPTFRLPLADGTHVYMEWHNYCGPTFFADKACRRQIDDWYEEPNERGYYIRKALQWFVNRGERA